MAAARCSSVRSSFSPQHLCSAGWLTISICSSHCARYRRRAEQALHLRRPGSSWITSVTHATARWACSEVFDRRDDRANIWRIVRVILDLAGRVFRQRARMASRSLRWHCTTSRRDRVGTSETDQRMDVIGIALLGNSTGPACSLRVTSAKEPPMYCHLLPSSCSLPSRLSRYACSFVTSVTRRTRSSPHA